MLHHTKSMARINFYQNWMAHYLPQIYYELLVSSPNDKIEITHALIKVLNMNIDPDMEQEQIYEYICGCIRPNYKKYMGMSINRMMKTHGYGCISSRKVSGAWSRFVDIDSYRGYPVRLVGKIIKTYDRDEPNLSGVCYNEIVLAKQVSSPRITHFENVIITGCINPRLSMGEVCLVQQRRSYDLATAFKKGKFVDSPSNVCVALMHIFEGLASIHYHQFIHLDMKPQNILFSHKGPLICDFGLSIRFTTQHVLDARKITLWYRPPEMILACLESEMALAEYDTSADMWSMGMIMWDFLVKRPMLAKMTVDDTESEQDLLKCLYHLVEVLGKPSDNDVNEWNLPIPFTSIFRTTVHKLPNTAKLTLRETAEPLMRLEAKKMPEWYLKDMFTIVGELLSWSPRKRPSASLVWSKLLELMRRLERCNSINTAFPVRMELTPLCELSTEEMYWRVQNTSPDELQSLWNRSLRTVQWLCKIMEKYMKIPSCQHHPEIYLDVLVLSCELYMRVQYAQGDIKSLFSENRQHSACICLAIQITRPYFYFSMLYEQFNVDPYKMQQVEQYVAYILDFRLYTENIVTQLKRKYPHSPLPYDDTYAFFVSSNSSK
jgi:serine/threonine protein kinase